MFYSFGVNYPGAITLNNTPGFLRDLHAPDGRHIDLSTVDVLRERERERERERGVPRYNAFRRLFHLAPATSFFELTGGNQGVAADLAGVYEDDVGKLDLLVECLAEPLPVGFGLSDMAFRVFILMASRRLKSDRLVTSCYELQVAHVLTL
ncbi:hypothetical protein G6011_07929 [Alternaria panax]|uniref:Uncharacterized protein n=1 Tax=Alternaria panax TaxID=48097 RepID=A0AAD4I1B4_9PLEO|nr:hypothetical protein G6011_07929 [Alternaria panax]